jgi:hypothetical protein
MTVARRAIVEGIRVVGGVYYCGVPNSGRVFSSEFPVQDGKKDAATAHFASTDPQTSNSALEDTAN